jgi:hypothetical protein
MVFSFDFAITKKIRKAYKRFFSKKQYDKTMIQMEKYLP